jgi:hypothetical protein
VTEGGLRARRSPFLDGWVTRHDLHGALPTAQSNGSERRNAPRRSEPAAKPLRSIRRCLRRDSRRKRRGHRAPDLIALSPYGPGCPCPRSSADWRRTSGV